MLETIVAEKYLADVLKCSDGNINLFLFKCNFLHLLLSLPKIWLEKAESHLFYLNLK